MGRLALAFVATACLAAGATPAARQLAMEPLKDAGQNVYPAFEGWYQNSDGSYTLLIGYYNRNKKQTLDIPIGPENRIEPGGPDQGQPTHFVVGRGWGTISIKVPKDFGDKKINWTLTANGKTATIPFGITKGYQIEPYKDEAMGNTPPKIKLAEAGPALTGGDLDANWETAYSTGDEAPGGDNPTPDQDIVDQIGKSLGLEYEDDEELKGAAKLEERDKHRWELDPASSEDYEDR